MREDCRRKAHRSGVPDGRAESDQVVHVPLGTAPFSLPTNVPLPPCTMTQHPDAVWTELRGSDSAGKMGVAKLLNSVWPENGTSANRFARLQKSSDTIFALLTPDAQVLASGSLRTIRESDGIELTAVAQLSPSPCVLFSLLVDTRLQGQGLGSSLLRQMEAEAAARGHCHVFLNAEPHLARGFYEKRGYEKISSASWRQRTRKPMDWLRKAVCDETAADTYTDTQLFVCRHATAIRPPGD